MPTAVVFNHRDGVYMIDSDSTDYDDSQMNILVWMVSVSILHLVISQMPICFKGYTVGEVSHIDRGQIQGSAPFHVFG